MLSMSTHRNGASWSNICQDLENAAMIIATSTGNIVPPSALALMDSRRLRSEIADLEKVYRESPSYASFYEPVLGLIKELCDYLPMIRGRSDYLLMFTDDLLEAEWGRRVSTAYEVFLYIANLRRLERGDVGLKGICVDFSNKKRGGAR